ncbi:MAG: C25 family cysteine peptidase [Bacteroidota bacterium]
MLRKNRRTGAWLVITLLLAITSLHGQIVSGLDTLYGYEWIAEGQTYAAVKVAEDGLYRINYEDLAALGWPLSTVDASDFALHHQGEAVFYYASNGGSGPLQAGDYLLFYGQQNRGELDEHLYRNAAEEQLNPRYSLITDTATYYLSYATDDGQRYTTVPNDLTAPPAPEAYVWQMVETIFNNRYLKEYYRFSGATLYYSHMGIGEGYGNRSVNELLASGSTVQNVDLDLPNAYTNGPAAQLSTRYVSALFNHQQRLSANGQELRFDTTYNWTLQNVATALPATVLTEGEARLEWEGFADDKDEVSIGFVQVRYPALVDADGASSYTCELQGNGLPQRLVVNNFGASSAQVFDLNNGQHLVVSNIVDGTLEVVLPATVQLRRLLIVADAAASPTVNPRAVNLNLPEVDNAEYIILTHSQLRGDGDPVQAYADYRASLAGGGYRTAIVNVDDLFDQYAYGVQQHPIAIRNFVESTLRRQPDFKYLFIIGKGREYTQIRTPSALADALGTTLFVPTFGFPASDNLLVSDKLKPTPRVGIGRLAAISPAEVNTYLNKIQGMETAVANAPQTIEGKAWMKGILQLGGGRSPSEHQSIKTHLDGMRDEMEAPTFGAEVTGLYRTSTEPIETSQTDAIFERINGGVSLITFFGHSSAGNFDFNIDSPDNYENVDKYPLILSLGCYSGNMFANFESIGERFIRLENGGAGVYAASRGLAFIHSLGAFGRTLHEKMADEYYGQPVSDAIRSTIASNENLVDLAFGALNEQFQLQGDPVFRLNPSQGPDYTFDPLAAKLLPSVVNVQRDSFTFAFDLLNLGRATTDSIQVTVQQQLPTGEVVDLYDGRVLTPWFRRTVTLQLPTQGKPSVGLNRLLVQLDASQVLTEFPTASAEQNNDLRTGSGELGVPLFVVDNTANPVFPPRYGLISGDEVTLKATTADPLAEEKLYLFQLATQPTFAAPIATTQLVQKGGVLEWSPELSWQDSTVYYWRVTPDSSTLSTGEYLWEASSFTYLAELENNGWGQGHWGQWQDGDFERMFLGNEQEFLFVDDQIDISIRNKIWESNDRPGLRYDNGSLAGSVRPWNYINQGVGVVVAMGKHPDRLWFNPPTGGDFAAGDYGVPTGSNRAYAFPTATQEQRENLLDFLTDVVPEGADVYFFTVLKGSNPDLSIDDWAQDSVATGRNIFQLLEAQGAASVRELEVLGNVPYTFIYKKNGGVIAEGISPDPFEAVTLEFLFPITSTSGNYASPVFGPGRDWEQYSWELEPTETDVNVLSVYGGDSPTSLNLLRTDTVAQTGELNISDLAGDAVYTQFRWEAFDELTRVPSPLKHFHLRAGYLPDLAINPALGYSVTGDSLAEGKVFAVESALTNISSQDFGDSVRVSYALLGTSGLDITGELQLEALASNESGTFSFEAPTIGLGNSFQLLVNVNPANQPLEATRINNLLLKEVVVLRDQVAPVVHVAFDGNRILNEDLVSASPLINIELIDENRQLPLDRPELLEVAITRPDGQEELLNLLAGEVDFSSTFTTEANRAAIRWQPDLVQDGLYTLRVRGRDASGNTSGTLWKEISFEVQNATKLSNFLPYPNPFTSQARFVYTLTGNAPLDGVSLQIMTVSGRVVREIRPQELGPLQVGTHQTDFSWDGTDDYGDQLANGVYLYRLLLPESLREQGADAHYARSEVDRFFANDLGKIVILR